MFQKLRIIIYVTVILIITVIVGACSEETVSTVIETAVVNPEQSNGQPGMVAPDEGDLGVPAVVLTEGSVTVVMNKPQVKVDESIAAIITNGLAEAIYTDDMKTGCTFATLEKWSESRWEKVLLDCGMERSPIAFAIGPGMSRTVIIDPSNRAFATTDQPAEVLDTGKYRLLFTYRLEPGRGLPETQSITSDEWMIVTSEPTSEDSVMPTMGEDLLTSGEDITTSGGRGVPTNVSDGLVTVNTQQTSFTEGESIIVMIANGLDQPIYADDMKSDCTFSILEMWDGAAWQTLRGCEMERTPIVIAIDPGMAHTVTLDPLSIHFKAGSAGNDPAFQKGTYRILFTYRLDATRDAPEPLSVYSDEFAIAP